MISGEISEVEQSYTTINFLPNNGFSVVPVVVLQYEEVFSGTKVVRTQDSCKAERQVETYCSQDRWLTLMKVCTKDRCM